VILANVPELQSLKASDFPEDFQESAARIAAPFNAFTSQANNALNQNLTFGQNFRGEVKSFDFTQTSKEITFKYSGAGTPSHILVTKLSALPQTAITPYWINDGRGNVTVTLVGDLNASDTTTVTLLVIAE
jgi:hypothetical protein